MLMEYDPNVWGPHYWFFINTIGFVYPEMPTDGEKKKFYNFIQCLPDFIPHDKISNKFKDILDEYPVSSYLNSKESLLKWIHFIHNKINVLIDKKELSYLDFINQYNNLYKPRSILDREKIKLKEKYIYVSIIIILLGVLFYKR
tara:strand:- start:92 stop:523 length:432 start_codon:yes stop_codon:yes gene_type:complete